MEIREGEWKGEEVVERVMVDIPPAYAYRCERRDDSGDQLTTHDHDRQQLLHGRPGRQSQ